MTIDVSAAATLLRQIAGAHPVPPAVGPWPLLHVDTSVGLCRLRLRAVSHPELLLARADRLEKQARGVGRLGTPKTRPHPKRAPKQAKYSARIAQQFLDDGEPENYRNYCELYA
jgi:hypothetical protein